MPNVRGRRALVWLLSLPLMLAGSQVAHALAYRIAYPEAQLRAQDLVATGHSYLDIIPRLAGLGFAIELVAFVVLALDRRREGPPRSLPAWAFAALPASAFTAQEFVERLLALHTLPWWMVEQPTFRIGLALQLPVGLAVYLIARLLLGGSVLLGRALRHRRPRALVRRARSRVRRPGSPVVRPLAVAVCGWGLRGPPVSVSR
jgi:hypothetical protein